MLTLLEVQELIAHPKSLVSEMVWSSKRGKIEFQWISCRMAVQLDHEAEVREQFFVECQWRKRVQKIPEHWTFNLLYQGNRIYALHVQPSSIHENKIGKGKPYFGQEINGMHEHIWVEEGDGYAVPISVPLDKPEVIWKMFLSRSNIGDHDFFHPDDNQPELEL